MAIRSHNPMPTMQANQMMPTSTVYRSRLRSATDDPVRLDDTPPPNMLDSPPPLPRCSRMSRVNRTLVMMSRTTSVYENASMAPVDPLVPNRGVHQRIAGQAHFSSYRAIRANSSASRLAPPTRAPSMSGCAMISAMLDDLTEPPYRTRTRSAVGPGYSSAIRARIAPM